MSRYFISDTHFGHANIIKHCKRPFSNVDEMDETIIKNWNNVVSDTDDVYMLGDFCCSNSPLSYFNKLNGRIHLILGNHDKTIRKIKHPKVVSVKQYEEIINNNGKRIILFHYPLTEWNGFFRDSIHIYGHIHNNTDNHTFNIMKNIKNAYNAGVDILDFSPRSLSEVIQYNNRFFNAH